MFSYFLTHLKPFSSKDILIAISYLTSLKMLVGESSINFMSHVCGVSQSLKGLLMEQMFLLFAIASLGHDRYPGVNIR